MQNKDYTMISTALYSARNRAQTEYPDVMGWDVNKIMGLVCQEFTLSMSKNNPRFNKEAFIDASLGYHNKGQTGNMTAKQMKVALEGIYIEWMNNYLTTQLLADHLGIRYDQVTTILDVGRDIHISGETYK